MNTIFNNCLMKYRTDNEKYDRLFEKAERHEEQAGIIRHVLGYIISKNFSDEERRIFLNNKRLGLSCRYLNAKDNRLGIWEKPQVVLTLADIGDLFL